MDNPQVLIICLDCNHNGTNIGNDMQCKNCLSYNTRRFIETEPVMDEVAWHNFGYVWAKWRNINWYSAMGDIEDHRKEFGDADTLQACVEGMARARLTQRPPDYCFYCDELKPPAKESVCQDCIDLITRNSG